MSIKGMDKPHLYRAFGGWYCVKINLSQQVTSPRRRTPAEAYQYLQEWGYL